MAIATITTFAATAASQHGAISRQQLTACGMSREQVRHQCRIGTLQPVVRDVFIVTGSADTWRRQLWIGLLEAGPGSFASHRTAAALLQLPGYDERPVDITITEMGNRPLRQGTRHVSAWAPANQRTIIDGIPCSRIGRCVFELAGLASPARRRRGLPYVHEARVERTYDNATKRGLTYHDACEVVATLGKRGRKGTQLMRRILAERGEGSACTESELEDLFVAVLIANDMPIPVKQRVLGGDLPAGRVDFLYQAAMLVIEVDSRLHHSALLDRRNDGTRDLDLAAAGFDVLRISHWDLVHQPEKVIAAIRRKIAC